MIANKLRAQAKAAHAEASRLACILGNCRAVPGESEATDAMGAELREHVRVGCALRDAADAMKTQGATHMITQSRLIRQQVDSIVNRAGAGPEDLARANAIYGAALVLEGLPAKEFRSIDEFRAELVLPIRSMTGDSPAGDDLDVRVGRSSHTRAGLAARGWTGRDPHADAFAAGMWMRSRLLHDRGATRWLDEHPDAIETRAAGEAVNSAGGFLVPDRLDNAIIINRDKAGVFRRYADVRPMDSDTLSVPILTTGLTAAFCAEAGTVAESDDVWGLLTLSAKKLAVMSRFSSELGEDSVIDMVARLSEDIGYAFAVKEDACGFMGDGTALYGGMTGVAIRIVDGTHGASIAQAVAPHNLFSELDAADLAAAVAILPEYAHANAKWFCSNYAAGVVFQRLLAALVGNDGNAVAAGFRRSYLGYEIVPVLGMPAGIATDYDAATMILFGDLKRAAALGNRRGVTLRVDPSKYFDTDQIAVRGTQRFDCVAHSLGDATTAGPIIAITGHAA